jgi:glycosyltransferase involved in cell wall biosynthesis
VPSDLLPVAVIIPTVNRVRLLRRTLESLAEQSAQPAELKIVDASDDGSTRLLCKKGSIPGLASDVSWYSADRVGAASQRNQGFRACSQPVVGYMDDDIILNQDCFVRLWRALQSDDLIGGVNAMITNQRYQKPGAVSQLVFGLLAGRVESSYAGRVIGPAVNLLPEDRDDLPDVVPVEWLNTTCTLYRRDALPNPPFPAHFSGYSLMEDLALSLEVGKQWNLANARTARIYHDSQAGGHKADSRVLAEMQLVNRHYVMTEILRKKGIGDYVKLICFESFSLASLLKSKAGRSTFPASLRGKLRASWQVFGAPR